MHMSSIWPGLSAVKGGFYSSCKLRERWHLPTRKHDSKYWKREFGVKVEGVAKVWY